MKKLFLLAVIVLCGNVLANAQDDQKVQFGLRAGLNISNYGGDAGDKMDKGGLSKSLAGFHIGGIVDINVAENFYIQPGLYITTKGGKDSEKESDWKVEVKSRPVYLQIPVLASYRINIADETKWHINVGPYIAFGMGGKSKYTEKEDGEPDYKEDTKLFSKTKEDGYEYDAPYKRFDAGLSFGTGVSFNKYYLGISYDLGLANINNIKDLKNEKGDKYKARNNNFMISLGYNF